jgi:hypothetical protein
MTIAEYKELNRAVEILQAVPSEKNLYEVTTDFFGSVLYPRSHVVGFGWRSVWTLVDFVTQSTKSKEEWALQAQFQRIQKIFCELIQELDVLHQNMQPLFRQKQFQKEEMASLRQRVDEISSSLPSLFNLAKPFHLLYTIRHINRLGVHLLQGELLSLSQEKKLHAFELKAALCALDGILQTSCPLRAFSVLLEGCDTDGLDEWLRAIKEKEQEISPWLLHQAITGIVSLLVEEGTQETVIAQKVACIEIEFMKKGCHVFKKQDPFYKEWLHTLTPGTCLDPDVLIGEHVEHSAFQKLALTVFERKGTNELLVLGKNACLLGMWKAQHVAASHFVPSVKIVKEDPYGRYVAIEKVQTSIDRIAWRSRFGSIHDEDKERADEIARLIAYMACQKNTPKRFKARYLFLKPEDVQSSDDLYGSSRLCTLLPFQKTEAHNFNRLLQVIYDTSQGSHIIFRYLMRKSKLISHPVALFYLQRVEEALRETQTKSLVDHAAISEMHDVQVVEQARKIVGETKELQHRLYLKLAAKLESREKEEHEKLKTEIVNALVAFQKDTGCSAVEWHEGAKIVEEYISASR